MGTRSMNILAIRPECRLTPAVAKYLQESLVQSSEAGSLYVWESNFAPMWARTGVADLQEELAIQEFLGALPPESFYLMRAGAECGIRGAWNEHPFQTHESVVAVAKAYRDEVREEAPQAVLVEDFFAPYPVVLSQPGGEDVYKIGLAINGMEIVHPRESECGRFTVDPQETYGLDPKQVAFLHKLNSLLDEAVQDAVNAGCLRIQTELGVPAGDYAGVHFAFGPALNAVTRAFGDYMVGEIRAGDACVMGMGPRPAPADGQGTRAADARDDGQCGVSEAFEMADLIRAIDADSEALLQLLDHSGSLESVPVLRAAASLRRSIALAAGDRERARYAQESLDELVVRPAPRG